MEGKNKKIEDLEADIAEFKSLLESAKRDNVKYVLNTWIEKCESQKV